jgi:hypothetical protein
MENSIAKWTRKIKDSNKAFKKMPKARKRVQIAKDVIEALKAEKLIASAGSYIRAGNVNGLRSITSVEDGSNKESLQEALFEIPQCSVCAKGAILACVIMRRNQMKVDDLPNSNDDWRGFLLEPLLGGIFEADQLHLMETEFESADYEHLLGGDWLPSGRFSWISDPKNRMIAMMENIIANKGTFIP